MTRDNQVVARTDSRGMAFVGGLRGYESNRIGIEAGDLPLDAEVDHLDIAVAPPSRTGVSITFPVRRTRSATLRVVDAGGEADRARQLGAFQRAIARIPGRLRRPASFWSASATTIASKRRCLREAAASR